MTLLTPITHSAADIATILRTHDVNPTSQRVSVAHALFSRQTHLSAEDVFRIVNSEERQVSKATVYNTLGLLAEKGVIREVIADPTKIFYDPNVAPHHHFFDEVTGELTDIDAHGVEVIGLPTPPPGTSVQGVDVIVRLRQKK